MGNALRLKCPSCKLTSECEVDETSSENILYKNKSFFEDFSQKEGNFRQRKRVCGNNQCKNIFQTLEVDEEFFDSLKDKINALVFLKKRFENLSVESYLLSSLPKETNAQEIKNISKDFSKFKNYYDLLTAIFGRRFSFNFFYQNIIDNKNNESFEEVTEEVLASLTPQEEKIIKMRFGLGKAESQYTLEEIGQHFAETRDNIEAIEAKSLRKLRHPSRSRRLKVFIEGFENN